MRFDHALEGALPGSERRSHQRFPTRVIATIEAERGRAPVACADISMGGLALTGAPGLRVGERFVVELELAGRRVSSDCEVVRAASGQVGARFLRLTQPTMTAILAHRS